MEDLSDKKPKDYWDKLKILSIIIGSVAVPLILGIVGHWFTVSLKERDVKVEMVKLSVEVLKADPKKYQNPRALRNWAMDVIDKYSGVPLSQEARNELQKQPLIVVEGQAGDGGVY